MDGSPGLRDTHRRHGAGTGKVCPCARRDLRGYDEIYGIEPKNYKIKQYKDESKIISISYLADVVGIWHGTTVGCDERYLGVL